MAHPLIAHFQSLGRYNALANRILYDACAETRREIDGKDNLFPRALIMYMKISIMASTGFLIAVTITLGEEIRGDACYRYSDNQSLQEAKTTVASLARRNALEKHRVFVSTISQVENFSLRKDIATTVAAGFLKNVKVLELTEDRANQKVCIRISAEVESKTIESFIRAKYIDETSIQEFQSMIRSQNSEIEKLRRIAHTAKQKKRLVGIINSQQKTINLLKSRAKKRSIPYTNRRYDENIAFINIESDSSGLDVYINNNYIGVTPIKLYEIEARKKHLITLRGDARYYTRTKSITRKYDKFQRAFELITVSRGKGNVIILSNEEIVGVAYDTKHADGQFSGWAANQIDDSAMYRMEAGKLLVRIYFEYGCAEIMLDLWAGDTIRRDIKKSHYLKRDDDPGCVFERVLMMLPRPKKE